MGAGGKRRGSSAAWRDFSMEGDRGSTQLNWWRRSLGRDLGEGECGAQSTEAFVPTALGVHDHREGLEEAIGVEGQGAPRAAVAATVCVAAGGDDDRVEEVVAVALAGSPVISASSSVSMMRGR